jgi:hypothetical protein
MNHCDRNEALHPTRMDIPPEIRQYVIQLLNQTLACTVDLRSQVKQAGWNVRGPDFAPLQALFATMASELDAYADLMAERIAVLGGWRGAQPARPPCARGWRSIPMPSWMVMLMWWCWRSASRPTPGRCGVALPSPRMSRMRTRRPSTPISRAGSISGSGSWKRTSTAEGPAQSPRVMLEEQRSRGRVASSPQRAQTVRTPLRRHTTTDGCPQRKIALHRASEKVKGKVATDSLGMAAETLASEG